MNLRNFITAAGMAVCGSVVCAQSISGTTFVEARCGARFEPGIGGGSIAAASHGTCSGNGGVIASINDATLSLLVVGGTIQGTLDSHTNFFGTSIDAGTASASYNAFCIANDVVFTEIANPTHRFGIDPISYNFFYGLRVDLTGVSNCNPFQHSTQASFESSCAGANASAAISRSGGNAAVVSGYATGYAGDGSIVAAVSPTTFNNTVDPHTFYLHAVGATSVLYCDSPPAAVGDAFSVVYFALPCGSPVFNLPPGITANSAALGIVNNIRSGASVSGQPGNATTCAAGTATLAVAASGAGLSYQWQWRPVGVGNWSEVAQGVNVDAATGAAAFTASGARTAQIQLVCSGVSAIAGPHREFRVLVGSPCGEAQSAAAVWTVCGGDFNCDGVADFFDYLDFVDAFASGAAGADVNADGAIDFFDYLDFVAALSSGC